VTELDPDDAIRFSTAPKIEMKKPSEVHYYSDMLIYVTPNCAYIRPEEPYNDTVYVRLPGGKV
jgi:hypothetical protein